MAGTLRKVPQSDGRYVISGPLDGVVPGRRVVKWLESNGIDGAGTEGLAPLEAFGDLETLELERVRNVDLDVLGRLDGVVSLMLKDVAGVDFGTFAAPSQLRRLRLVDVDDHCVIPHAFDLPDDLESLSLGEGRRAHTSRPVEQLVAAIDWSALPALRSLDIRVGGLDPVPPAELDLRFLEALPQIESLFLDGIEHVGPGPNPLRPPFDGIPRERLRRLIIGVPLDEREAIRAEAHKIFDFEELGVRPRGRYVPPPPAWQVDEDEEGRFSAFGSLSDAFELPSSETEHDDALPEARRRLREADSELLGRLDFDDESGGTTVSAPSREDLVRALEILGLPDPA